MREVIMGALLVLAAMLVRMERADRLAAEARAAEAEAWADAVAAEAEAWIEEAAR